MVHGQHYSIGETSIHPENFEAAIDPESLAENLRNYINDMINKPFPKYCGGSDETEIREDEQIVRIVPCHEKGALKQ